MSVSVTWVLGLMIALEPEAPWRGTYQKTAEAIAHIAEAEPLAFGAKDKDADPARTAALLVAVAWAESHLRPNAKSRKGPYYCLYQLHRSHLPDPQQALDDPEVCTRAAMKLFRASFDKCNKQPVDERLAVFAASTCEKGVRQSRYRMYIAKKLLKEHPAPAARVD
jgi:hypothetical protein